MTVSKAPASSRSADRWENEGGPTHKKPGLAAPASLDSDLKRLGITPVQLTVFDWNGYRYSNVKDAIAAAKRTQAIELPLPSAPASLEPAGKTHL